MTLLSRIGKAFMVPIALLPAMGLMLGIGSTMLNPDMQAILPFLSSEIWVIIAEIMVAAGSITFANLPLLFAIGVAMGLSNDSGVAGLSGAIGYLVMRSVTGFLTVTDTIYSEDGTVTYVLAERLSHLPQEAFGMNLGIPSVEMGVFGGIIIGLITAFLYSKYKDIVLPEALSFFAGPRFIPIVTSFVAIAVGILMAFVWPPVQNGILELSKFIATDQTSPLAIWGYGFTERILIPFGLHHIFYTPFWFTAAGGVYVPMSGGATVMGDVPVWFAQYADYAAYGGTEFFAYLEENGFNQAGRFMTGKYPFMIFGLPAAALAMYHVADKVNRPIVKGLLFSAALTAMLTGITEPIEFTFLFVAPLLYVAHSIMAGVSFMLMYILDVYVGMTFSGGIFDLFLYGILPGMEFTNWIMVIVVGLFYIPIYYFGFRWAITKFNLSTPGRGDNVELSTRATYNQSKENKKDGGSQFDELAKDIIQGLGGKENIKSIDACISRLRPTVVDQKLVDKEFLQKQTGAQGVLFIGKNGVQVIYGTRAAQYKDIIAEMLK